MLSPGVEAGASQGPSQWGLAVPQGALRGCKDPTGTLASRAVCGRGPVCLAWLVQLRSREPRRRGHRQGGRGWPASPSSVRKVQALTGMMLLFAFLLFMGLPLGFVEPWTFNVQCHECIVKNTFHCPVKRTCPYDIRRCFTVSMRLNSREILVYKNCTFNCTFLYRAEEPPETPRRKTTHRFNSFYWVHCCGSNMCNFGGPTNLERDITLDYPLEEDIEGNAQLVQSTVFLSIVSILVRNTLT